MLLTFTHIFWNKNNSAATQNFLSFDRSSVNSPIKLLPLFYQFFMEIQHLKPLCSTARFNFRTSQKYQIIIFLSNFLFSQSKFSHFALKCSNFQVSVRKSPKLDKTFVKRQIKFETHLLLLKFFRSNCKLFIQIETFLANLSGSVRSPVFFLLLIPSLDGE